MDKLLAIFDIDVLYATRLMEYFKKSAWEGFEILLFTTRENLIDFLEYQAVEILLYGGEDLLDEEQGNNIKHLFFLSSDKKLPKDSSEFINKYQPASKITSDVLSLYTKLNNNNEKASNGNVHIISVFSPVTGKEKVGFSWFLAKYLSCIRKVLFIPLELLPTAHVNVEEERGQGLSEFLYYLKESKTDPTDKMKDYINYSEKLSYLGGLTHGFDLLSINKEDVVRFIDSIKEHKDYEMVIFYLGIYTEASMEILKLSDRVCVVTGNESYDELLKEEWERQMSLLGDPTHKPHYHLIKLHIGKSELESNDQLSKVAIEFAEQII